MSRRRKPAVTAAELEAAGLGRTVRLTAEDIEAIAEALFTKLRRVNTERVRRRRMPCGRGSSVPVCMGSAVYGPNGCTCR